jgi:hypothetical protein
VNPLLSTKVYDEYGGGLPGVGKTLIAEGVSEHFETILLSEHNLSEI